jgi:hypothetical protein
MTLNELLEILNKYKVLYGGNIQITLVSTYTDGDRTTTEWKLLGKVLPDGVNGDVTGIMLFADYE